MSLLIKKVLEKIKNIDNKLKTNIVTDIEIETNETIDGKIVYKKVINCGNLPNTSSKTIAINSSFTKIVKIEGLADASGIYLPLPYTNLSANGSIQVDVRGSNIQILTDSDRSTCTATVTIYYTKNWERTWSTYGSRERERERE